MRYTISDLIDNSLLFDLEKRVEEKDECKFGKQVTEEKEKLFSQLNEQQREQAKHFELAIRNQEEYIRYELQVFLINYAFRLGMEMQHAFDKMDYE